MDPQQVRDWLFERRAALCCDVSAPGRGRQLARAFADLVDQAVGLLSDEALSAVPKASRLRVHARVAVIALGGYGRREMAPFSDVDLLFLCARSADAAVLEYVKRLVRNIWDAGLSLGHNVATAAQILAIAKKEVLNATALLDARWLFGARDLLDRFQARFRRSLRWGGAGGLARRAVAAIRDEQHQFGSTPHLLEPDVKRSAGGLRQIHLLRWLATALHGAAALAETKAGGILASPDAQRLADAHDFLLRLRAEMHWHAQKPSDVLTRHEQLRIASKWGYRDNASLLGVEQFMRDYFRHTSDVDDIVRAFIARSGPRTLKQRARELLASELVSAGVRIGPSGLSVSAAERPTFVESLERTIELAELAAKSASDIDRDTVEALRAGYQSREASMADPKPAALAPAAIDRFLRMLRQSDARARTLRTLHQVGALAYIIPQFEHVRGLLQFNAYHKYTVDEHTLLMVERAEALFDQSGALADAYRKIVRKDLFFLTILLHDLGKGRAEDHAELGRSIAEDAARRINLPEDDRRILIPLVHRHLLMSHLAFCRDTSDPALSVQLSREVGSEQGLRMLYVLTAVDIMATGPGAFNQWKADLLTNLYVRTLRLFDVEEQIEHLKPKAAKLRERLLPLVNGDSRRLSRIDLLPTDFLAESTDDEIVSMLAAWEALDIEQVATLCAYRPQTQTVAYSVLTHERLTSGIFSKICGALAAHRLDVLSARIRTLTDGTVVDRFEVIDTHHSGPPDADRAKLIGKTIRRVLTGELAVSDALWSGRSSVFRPKQPVQSPDATKVVVDNSSSESCTVIDVFTADRRGLLYTLAKGINRLGLSVQFAKIATYSEAVVDVFYVQEADGKKVHRADRIRLIQDHLANDIDRLTKDPRAMGF